MYFYHIYTTNNRKIELVEGKGYCYEKGTAYYINQPYNAVAYRLGQGNITFNTSSVKGQSTITVKRNNNKDYTLYEGKDYYIGSDDKAYFYSNVRSVNEAEGNSVTAPGENGIAIESDDGRVANTTDYYIGKDGKAYYLYGPPAPYRGSEINTKYNLDIDSFLKTQMGMNDKPKISKNNKWVDASSDEVLEYLDPTNYDDGVYKYQFLDLSASAGISLDDMTEFLNGKGILNGEADTFLQAANKYGVSEVYLAAHAALETGNGTSELAKGYVINGVKVYNMYGIGAYDDDPIGSGAKFALKMGWTTPEKAIDGGAKYIAEQYINNNQKKQNTLYKMRWNPASPGVNQYATDIRWAINQTYSIKKMYDNFPNAILNFDIPVFLNY